MMLSDDAYRRLKHQVMVYSFIPAQLIIDESDRCFGQYIDHKGIITLGKKAPLRYLEHFQLESYEMIMEGLLLHAIGLLNYTDHHIMSQLFEKAELSKQRVNEAGLLFIQKKLSYKELFSIVYQYVYDTNLPLLLQSIEDGAIENALGIEYPEIWNCLMFTRSQITKTFLDEKHDVDQTKFLMDKIIKEIMVICTYGYRFKVNKSIVYLPRYLYKDFENIRYMAIKGRLQSQDTSQRLKISQQILDLCQPIMNETVKEIIDTIRNTQQVSGLSNSLFNDLKSEISVNYQNSDQDQQTKQTPSKYQIDLTKEEFDHIETIENQQEKQQQHQILKEIYQRRSNNQDQEKSFKKQLLNRHLEDMIIHAPMQRTTPTSYGLIALKSQKESIIRSNDLSRKLKREIMYASKSTTKRKLEYGRQLDQQNLYRATLDGRVFMEHREGHQKNLCVYILVDTSESMSGNKIINTMKGCYELARVMQTLNIPFCISAHKSIGETKVQMTEIISFKDCKKRYLLDRIYAMHVSGGTHEEIALEYVLKELNRYKRARKGFVFVLSDGDTPGIDHIHELTHYYKKENIDVIGIGIQTAPKITETYPHGLFIEDIQKLPDTLIQKLREIAL